MDDITFITGNQHKADYLALWLDMPVKHHKLDLDEIQSLDLREVTEHKARQAHALLNKPVLVEDSALTFHAMGRLPGTLVKWFIQEIGMDGLCKLADGLPDRTATAAMVYAFYDGTKLQFFEGGTEGHIAPKPRGSHGFGWNPIFIPEGSDKTFAQMTDDEIKPFNHRYRAIQKLRAYLQQK